MKAIICPSYGPPEVLKIATLPNPVPLENEILVDVHASAVNSGDVRVRGLAIGGILRLIMRFVLGFSRPRKPVLGTVFAGTVASVGDSVSLFAKGDRVYGTTGFSFGTYAEQLTIHEEGTVTFMPRNASFEEAAALPFGGQTALYFLNKSGISTRNKPSVLIIGATGSVGTAAIQVVRQNEGVVTAVCSSAGAQLAKDLGAQLVIPYDQEDFTKTPHRFDIVFDAVGKTTKKQCAHLLRDGGSYCTVYGFDVASETRAQLEQLRNWFEAGTYLPVIDKVFDMVDVVEAHRYVDTGRKKGNVVLKIR